MAEWLTEPDKKRIPTKSNYLIICLDSCRYDSFKAANTPNFDKIGKLGRAYSLGGMTAPAIFSFFMNVSQYNEGRRKFLEEFPRMCWLPQELRKRGYHTALISPNPSLFVYKSVFGRWFDTYRGLKMNWIYAADKIINADIQLFKTVKKKKFIFNLFMATHMPYSDGKRNYGKRPGSNRPQIKAVEAIDAEFSRLIPYLQNTKVTICADHGELFEEEGKIGHSPGMAVFHRKLFAVPVIRGLVR